MAHTGEAGTSSSGRKTCDIKGLVKCQNCQRGGQMSKISKVYD